MRERAEWRMALAMLTASAGVGLSSGRELALFFGQLKGACWTGVAMASAFYGLPATWLLSRGKTGLRGSAWAKACEAGWQLLAALMSACMLYQLGRVGELTLPIPHSYAAGAAIGLALALLAGRLSVRGRALAGMFVALGLSMFFAANLLDQRPAKLYLSGDVEFALAGRLPAAVLLAAMYACLNGCAAMMAVWRGASVALRPAAVGWRSALLNGALLTLAVAALRSGGDMVLAHPMPWVVLSARWGAVGFWSCAALTATCAVGTLSAAVSRLTAGLWSDASSRRLSLCMLLTGTVVFCALTYGRGTA